MVYARRENQLLAWKENNRVKDGDRGKIRNVCETFECPFQV